jgi:predicted dehydrogenase/cell division protein ZapA (FtsZ GTPase activity inhibitor)
MDPGAPDKQSVRVTIFNQTYVLRASVNADETAALASRVDEIMSVIAARTGASDPTRVAVLACLHLADRLQSLERQVAQVQEWCASRPARWRPCSMKSSSPSHRRTPPEASKGGTTLEYQNMPDNLLHPRRSFLATTLAGAPALLAQSKPGETLGVGIIGVGLRGKRLLGWAQQAPNAEIRIMADLYDANLRKAQDMCMNRKVRLTKEWERVIEDPSIQAVIIATPDFWHAPMVIAAAKAGKHIYCEKGLCLNLQQAKAIRKAVLENKVVFQLGHHYNSWPTYVRAKEIFKTGALGKVALVRSCYDNSGQYPHWKFYASDYETHTIPADATPEHIDWQRFQDNAPKHEFSADRFFTWRCYWDYGTGLAGDVMSHMWDATNMIMGLGIPEMVSAQGGQYMWKQLRDVPDVWNTTFEYPSKVGRHVLQHGIEHLQLPLRAVARLREDSRGERSVLPPLRRRVEAQPRGPLESGADRCRQDRRATVGRQDPARVFHEAGRTEGDQPHGKPVRLHPQWRETALRPGARLRRGRDHLHVGGSLPQAAHRPLGRRS